MSLQLSPARVRRISAALKAELRLWLNTVIAGGAVTFALWSIVQMVLGFLRAPAAGELKAALPLALPWFAAGVGLLFLLFVLRGVAVGLSGTYLQAEHRARAVTMTSIAVIVAVTAGAMAFAWPARADTFSESASDYCARDLGSWFYCNRPAPPPPAKPASSTDAGAKPAEIKELEAFQKEVDEARQIAVWAPTEENVRRFYLLQKKALDRGGLFADQWRRLVWTNPELDYTLKRPVSEVGKRAWEDERLFDREAFLKAAGPELGLFYVFRGTCGACKIFSPILSAFSNRFQVAVTAISADGAANPEFSNVVVDRGQLKAWGFRSPATPAVLIFQRASRTPVRIKVSNGKTVQLRPCLKPKGCLTYLGAGVMSVEEMADRMFVLLTTEPGQDF